jgi:hypothetical protein
MSIITLIITYLVVANATSVVPKEAAPAAPAPREVDGRVVALRAFLEKHDSPLAPYAADFVASADAYDVDWRLLPAISGVESSFGKRLIPGSHNAYGWGGGYIYFRDWEEGIETVNRSLRRRYLDRGADTVDEIGPIYAEASDWASKVKYFMEKIDEEEALNLSASATQIY